MQAVSWSFSGAIAYRTTAGLTTWPGLPQSMAAELTPRASIPGDKKEMLHHLSCLISTANKSFLPVGQSVRLAQIQGDRWSPPLPRRIALTKSQKEHRGEDMRQPVLESTTSLQEWQSRCPQKMTLVSIRRMGRCLH